MYGYNSAGQVTTVTGHKGTRDFEYVKKTGYDEFGQRVYIDYGNDVTTRYTYDPARRWLTSVRSTGPQGLTYQDIGYSFDAVGNVLGYTNSAAGYETNQRYTYDGLYQLIKAEGDSIGRSGAGTGLYDYETHYEQAFSFDMIGNMTEKKSRTRSPYANPPGVNLDYESQYTYKKGTHQAIQIGSARYEYDGNGNVIIERYGDTGTTTGNKRTHQVREEDGVYSTDYGFALTLGSAGSGSANTERRYVWNERNLLKRSSDGQYAVEYRYGADGQRAIKYAVKQGGSGERTETLYYNKWYQLVSTNDNHRMVESKHIYVGETRIATKQRHDDNSNYSEELKHTYYYHGDHLGSAQVVTNGSGEIYEHIEYTPYGELWVDHTKRIGSEEGTPFRFTGKEYDEETGLYYYGARYLDPKTSRWISTDPAMGEYIPGAPINDEAKKRNQNLPGMGGVFNYVNLHTYHYAGNNPIKLIDPNGRTDIDEIPGLIPVGSDENTIYGDFNEDYTNTESAYTRHEGIDWAVPIGTEIQAQRKMTVVDVRETSSGYGNYLILQDAENPELFYLGAHMDTITVKKGDTVEAGQSVGTSGDTGAGGAHFHVSTSIINSEKYADYRYSNGVIRADRMVNPYDHEEKWNGKVKP